MGHSQINWKTITWQDFQGLCCRLLYRVYQYDIRPSAIQGADGGIDATVGDNASRDLIVQCKHWTTPLTLSKFKKEIIKELNKISEKPNVSHYILMTSYSLTKNMKEWFNQNAHYYSFAMEHIDAPTLELWLEEQQDVRQEYFGIKLVEHNWDSLCDTCFNQVTVKIEVLRDRKKYIPELYSNRAIQQEFDQFLYSKAKCFSIVGKAGVGKTNLLCHLSHELTIGDTNQKIPSLILLGGSIILNNERSLVRRILCDLLYDENANIEMALKDLANIANKQGQKIIIMIDAVNENPDIQGMRKSLEYLAEVIRDKPIKLCISCRDIFWDYFRDCFIKSDIYDQLTTGANQISVLGDFDDNEFQSALIRYLKYFSIKASIMQDTQEKLRHPLLLRFFCEAYRDREIGIIEDIHLLELFDLYWERKLANVSKSIQLRSNYIPADFLLTLSELMREKETNVIPLQMVLNETKTCNDSADSIYTRILDENIILQEDINTPYSSPMVRFSYDEFFEYVMARGIWEKYIIGNYNVDSLSNKIVELASRNESFRHFQGAIQYVLLMAERKDKNLFIKLIESLTTRCNSEFWIQTICMLIRRVDVFNWPYANVLVRWVEGIQMKYPKSSIVQEEDVSSTNEGQNLKCIGDIYPDALVLIDSLIQKRSSEIYLQLDETMEEISSLIEIPVKRNSQIVKRFAANELLLIANREPEIANRIISYLAQSKSRKVKRFIDSIKPAIELISIINLNRTEVNEIMTVPCFITDELNKLGQQSYMIYYIEYLLARCQRQTETGLENLLSRFKVNCRLVFMLQRYLQLGLYEMRNRERQVLECRFGLGLPGNMTQSETSIFLNISRATVRHDEFKCLRKLRHPSRSRRMRYYIDLAIKGNPFIPECALVGAIFGEYPEYYRARFMLRI